MWGFYVLLFFFSAHLGNCSLIHLPELCFFLFPPPHPYMLVRFLPTSLFPCGSLQVVLVCFHSATTYLLFCTHILKHLEWISVAPSPWLRLHPSSTVAFIISISTDSFSHWRYLNAWNTVVMSKNFQWILRLSVPKLKGAAITNHFTTSLSLNILSFILYIHLFLAFGLYPAMLSGYSCLYV